MGVNNGVKVEFRAQGEVFCCFLHRELAWRAKGGASSWQKVTPSLGWAAWEGFCGICLHLGKVYLPCGVPLCAMSCPGVNERRHNLFSHFNGSGWKRVREQTGKDPCIFGGCLSSAGVPSPGNLRFPSSLPQLFIFIQRKISSEEEAVMAEVYRYRDYHR